MSDAPRFLDHVKNEDSPGPPIGSHHAFFSDDQEPCPMTDIADLIRDSYEVPGPHPQVSREVNFQGGAGGCCLSAVWMQGGFCEQVLPLSPAEIRGPVCGSDRAHALQAQDPSPPGPRGHHEAERGE